MKNSIFILLFLMLLSAQLTAQERYTLQSPDEKITVTVNTGDHLSYSVKHVNTTILAESPIAMHLSNEAVFGVPAHATEVDNKKVDDVITPTFYKRKEIRDQYNELKLSFGNVYKVVFRAYNNGVAYRFEADFPFSVNVVSETADFNFDQDYTVRIPYVNARKGEGDFIEQQFFTSFENTYTLTPLTGMDPERLVFLPAMVEYPDGKKAVITEADLEDFPGLLLRNEKGGKGLTAVHAGYPRMERQGGHNNLQQVVKMRENYIAKVSAGKRTFPWRVVVISENDAELADCDLVYQLASPCRVKDLSWIKPGKVAWDWWNAWNIYGVDFQAGINTETYKYYIDFASKYGIEYVILDEGWAVNKKADLFQVVPEIDLPELIAYGKEKNVGLVLWAGYAAIDDNMERVCRHYSEMGIKGFKVDFMDRDDQKVVKFYYRMAEMAAKYHLFVDFHGAYKPTGLSRTYPNVLNYEGVYGLEQAKWDNESDLVTNEVTIPFIRMVAGPMDYTQGAMRNGSKHNFAAIYTQPMSQGTRCRQLAEYVIFESPFNMLCDSPSNYLKEDECTRFIAEVPTTWDETVVLDGKVGEYLVIARRKGIHWYIGAINNWEELDLVLDITPLDWGTQKARLFRDGANANNAGEDYVSEEIEVYGNKVPLHLAKGGGAVIVF